MGQPGVHEPGCGRWANLGSMGQPGFRGPAWCLWASLGSMGPIKILQRVLAFSKNTDAFFNLAYKTLTDNQLLPKSRSVFAGQVRSAQVLLRMGSPPEIPLPLPFFT